MAEFIENFSEQIGDTPIVRLGKIEQAHGLEASVFGKVEALNPAGSIKDRIALAMVRAAEQSGDLKPGSVIVEPTSGNTGVGLSFIGAQLGYRVILTMPETMTAERRKLLAAYGAEIILTPGGDGMKGAIEKAKALTEEIEGAFMPGQFENPANPAAHEATTGPEIWKAMNSKVDIFVSGVGTGGTITGAGRYLKKQNPGIEIVAVEPASSPVLSKGKSGPHKIQGIGAGFVPKVLDREIYSSIIAVSDEDAYYGTKELARKEGIFAGISSGAALFAAIQLASFEANRGKRIVCVLPDSGDRYLSTGVFD